MLGMRNPSGNSTISYLNQEAKIGHDTFSENTARHALSSEPGTSLRCSSNVLNEHNVKVSGTFPCFECGAISTCVNDFQLHWKTHAQKKQFAVCTHISSGADFHSHSSLDNGGNSSSSKDDAIDTANESSQIASELKNKDRFCFSENKAPIFSGPATSLSPGVLSIKDYSKVSGKLSCFECVATFTSEYNLKMHLKTHANQNQFPVGTPIPSGSGFRSHSSLDNGGNSSSSNEAIDTINESSRIASEKKRRDRLRRSKYLEENIRMKRFVCDNCQKVFPLKPDLIRHIRTHTGEKPYECNICHKKFTLHGNLSVHLRIHKGEKPFTCDVCNYSFSQKCNLLKHKLIHKRA